MEVVILTRFASGDIDVLGTWDFPGSKEELIGAVVEGLIPGNVGARGEVRPSTQEEVDRLVAEDGCFMTIDDTFTPELHVGEGVE